MSSLKNKTPKKLKKIKKAKNMSNRKYKGKQRNKRFRTYRKKKMKNKIRNSTIKLKKNIKKMNASIIRVRKRILQKLKKQYKGGAPGDENKEREGKFWQCKNCNIKIPNTLYNSNKGGECETSTCKLIINETNYNLVDSETPGSPPSSKLVPPVTPGDLLLPGSPSDDTPGSKDRPEEDDDDPPPGDDDDGDDDDDPPPGDDDDGDDDDDPPPPKDPKPLDETKEFGGKVSDAITKNPTETNPLLNPDREGKNRGQIYYHTGVTIESAATYTQGQVDKKLADIEKTVRDDLKRSEDDDDSDDSDYDPNEDSDDDDENSLASKKIVLTLFKSQPS
jgi:hypothetical protein